MPHVLVLEDDIDFKEPFDTLLENCISELPDNWDALWLGGTENKVEGYSPNLKRLITGTGGYGVLIRETMYESIIELMEKEIYQSDICYMKLMNQFNCFKSSSNLILHKAGYSTIQKKNVSYPKLMQ